MNSAERVLAIYDKLVQHQGDTPMMKTWAAVFEVPTEGPHLEDDITACLVALRSEIQLTKAQLAAAGIPTNLHGPGLDRLHNTASPTYLTTNWNSLRGNVYPPECRLSLDWICWALRDENEGDVSIEERNTLGEEIAALEAKLDELPMSPYMREFIKRQVETIRLALRIYGIQGARPLQDALRRVVGDFKVEDARIKAEHAASSPEAKSLWGRASTIIEKAAKLADHGSKLKKGAEDLGALAGAVQEQVGSMVGAVKPLLLPFIMNVSP
jgi:hypothetical protein